MRRRQKYHDLVTVDSEGSWAISYGDMVTLLLTFFIVFFTADKFEEQKEQSVSIDFLKKSADHFTKQMEAEKLVDKKTAQMLKAKTYLEGNRVIIEFSGLSFFKSASTDIEAKAQSALASFYKSYEPFMSRYHVAIRAFSDPRPLREKSKMIYNDNLQLSTLRSLEVLRYLQKSGVPLANMRIQGYGELKLSSEDINKLEPSEATRSPSAIYDLARTVVIMIEPKEDL